MAESTKTTFIKMFTDSVFYVGGVSIGVICYLTGLTPQQIGSAFVLIILDIISRVWAEKANNRPIISRKMYAGFSGKVMAYIILLIAANQIFFIGEYLQYVILSGFGLIEIRSIYENLVDAKQKHLDIIGDKINQEIENFKAKPNEEFTKPNDTNTQ
nr:phage holin family protein [Mycobacterium sp. E3298]